MVESRGEGQRMHIAVVLGGRQIYVDLSIGVKT